MMFAVQGCDADNGGPQDDQPQDEWSKIDPTGYAASTPAELKVNPKESIQDSVGAVGVWLVEGHSHAPNESRQEIGKTMWSTDFTPGNKNFHGNPFNPESKIPYRRDQYIEYKKDNSGKFVLDTEYSNSYKKQNVFDLQSTTPRKKYLQGVMYALMVKLYNKDYQNPRIDQLFKLNDSTRVQVFYKIKNLKPLRPNTNPLPKNLDLKDVCYYWYYDRLPITNDKGKYADSGNYFEKNAIGFRGVIQALEPYTTFDIEVSVSVLPKGLEQYKSNQNALSPSEIQARHIVFQFDIPFRTITSFPNFTEYAYEKMGMDFTDPNFDEDLFDKYYEEARTIYFKDLQHVYPDFSIEELKQLDAEQKLLFSEASNFVL